MIVPEVRGANPHEPLLVIVPCDIDQELVQSEGIVATHPAAPVDLLIQSLADDVQDTLVLTRDDPTHLLPPRKGRPRLRR